MALPQKEWGGSEGCRWKHSDAKPVHSHFASLGCGSPGGFSCSLSGSWIPTLSSFCECDREEPDLYGLTVILHEREACSV